MPPHSSHLLQPLNVGCFSVLKQSYGRFVEESMSLGVNHIDKQDFLSLYQQARTEALHERNIQSGFAATSLVPYKPDCVSSLLQTQLRTPSPELRPLTQPAWIAETPHDTTDVQNQAKLIAQYLKRRTQSPPSPTERAINQLVKGCQLAMHSAVLLANQNEKLHAENQRQKRKRGQKRSYVTRRGVPTGAEARFLIGREESNRTEVIDTASSGVRQRAPPECTVCSSLEHTARTCAQRQRTI